MVAAGKADLPFHSAADLAARFGLELSGNGLIEITGVAPLDRAQAGDLSFLSNGKYAGQLQSTKASVVVMRQADSGRLPAGATALFATDPYSAFARISALFEPVAAFNAGIHPSAVVDPTAVIDPGAMIGPQVVIGARATVAAGARIGAQCYIGDDCHVGEDCELQARVTLWLRVRLGKRVRILPGAVLGAAGFGLAMDQGAWINVPQLGGVVIGDDCEIGANTTIDRGAMGDTVLGNDVRLDNQIQIAHNVQIGDHTAMAGCSAVAGSAVIGRYCLIGGNAGILGHLTIADRVTVTSKSLVTHSIREPGEYSSGTPLMENREWRKNAARFKQLDALARRLGQLVKSSGASGD